ncbi:RidA family protein [Methylobacterium sp. J-088]|uniref:RidA family protein n=1 Tax=Methylobacterium sp. J-088 TaxID=2836664 RepID=UPI001FBBE691|nr:RidA family protein [Methylobacterium sp. J-088]MCJ2065479.1 RidA family protein [Methylobacterium sp. J-088]
MSDAVLSRLRAAGLMLPEPSRPAANYVPYTRAEPLLFISGQTPVLRGEPQYLGVVGEDVSIEQAQAAARLCALNILAQVHAALDGDLDRVRCLRLGGFVRCRPDFIRQPLVLNGASDLILLALGENGRHARTAVGTNALPRGVPVEVEAVFTVG